MSEVTGESSHPQKKSATSSPNSMVEIRPPNAPVPYEESFVPNYLADAVTDVDFQNLKEHGINTVLLDVDNTLVTVGGHKINPELLAFLRKVKEDNVIKHIYLASRAWGVSPRIQQIAEHVGAKVILSSMFRRKPSPKWFSRALEFVKQTTEENHVKPAQVAIIGDRIIHDVTGANKAGITTVLVNPIGDFILTDNLSLIPYRERRQQARLENYLNERRISHPALNLLRQTS